MKVLCITIACAVLSFGRVWGATITAVNSGNWGSNSTWSCTCQPDNNDNIIIPAGITVTSNGVLILGLGPVINLTIGGTLTLNNGSISLDSSDVITILSGGVIKGAGFFGGTVTSGLSAIGVPNGTEIDGPKTITNGTLPIVLDYFRSNVNEDGIVLEWRSLEEKKFDYYEIATSADGKSYTPLDTVRGKNENGAEYSFIDTIPLSTINYYKLTAVDLDGHREDMPVIKAEWNGRHDWISIYPNPINDGIIHVRLFGGGSGSLRLLDCNGMVMSESLVANAFTSDIQVPPGVPPGAYFVSAQMNGRVTQIKVLVR